MHLLLTFQEEYILRFTSLSIVRMVVTAERVVSTPIGWYIDHNLPMPTGETPSI